MNLTTPQEKIVAFCKYKSRRIKETISLTYMDKRDYKEIRQLPFNHADRILDYLRTELNYHLEDKGESNLLCFGVCPFCILNHRLKKEECSSCSYGKQHGICVEPDSNFAKINQKLIGYLSLKEGLLFKKNSLRFIKEHILK